MCQHNKSYDSSKMNIFVFAMFALAILYYAWTYEGDYSIWLVVPVVLCAVTIVMAPQIDWWWISNYPPKTPIPIKKMFEAKSNYFRQIDNSLKDFYFHRVWSIAAPNLLQVLGQVGRPESSW